MPFDLICILVITELNSTVLKYMSVFNGNVSFIGNKVVNKVTLLFYYQE